MVFNFLEKPVVQSVKTNDLKVVPIELFFNLEYRCKKILFLSCTEKYIVKLEKKIIFSNDCVFGNLFFPQIKHTIFFPVVYLHIQFVQTVQ